MNAKRLKSDRPPTVWLDDKPDWSKLKTSTPLSQSPLSSSDDGRADSTATSPLNPRAGPSKIRKETRDPWQVYEPIVEIFLGRSVYLAIHQEKKAELVNIQQLKQQPSSVGPLLDAVTRISHHSFPSLLACYYHKDHTFLVWEPAELSVSQILASKCSITESEIAAIVWPVLEGIKYLRDRGRALAALGAESVLLTESGHVKIAGAENSCEITDSEMDAAALKLFALAEIVEKLLKKNPPPHPWSDEAQRLPQSLRTLPVEELLQDTYLARLARQGGLKVLVKVANKTAYHRVEFFERP